MKNYSFIRDGLLLPHTTFNGFIYVLDSQPPVIGDWCHGIDGIFKYMGPILINEHLPYKIIATDDPMLEEVRQLDLGKDLADKLANDYVYYEVEN